MSGIHHVTAIAGRADRNLDFHTRVLGLRLVKKTVNFDDPGTYHLYYGDEQGQPGTILTFFPWAHAAAGQLGVGETQETAFRIPSAALGYWTHRLLEKGVTHGAPEKRFGDTVLPFTDPDGMRFALVAELGAPGAENEKGWSSDIPAEHAIRGFHGVTLLVHTAAPTAAILTDVLGFREVARDGALARYRGDAPLGAHVDLREAGDFPRGRMGRGSVHHIAFRAADDATQAAMAKKLVADHEMHPTEQKDRNYFRSIYFREPNGILFEIATDQPGFAVDEPAAQLGQSLKLPPFLEPRRAELEGKLPPLGTA
jgi:glyoxalase family protein